MKYRNREEAASRLVQMLIKYKNQNGIVMGIPRGGVPIACYIAKQLEMPVELLMTKKIGHPYNPEFAIGAVSLEDDVVDEQHNIPKSYINNEIIRIRENLNKKYNFLTGGKKPADISGKIVIIVDDGVATGNTILSSIPMLRRKKPEKIIVAVPVAPPEVANKIQRVVDELICPYRPFDFFGVGYHYLDFSEVTDEEVIRLLKEAGAVRKNT